MPDSPYLSIVIPAYNEQNRIAATLGKIIRYFQECNFSCEVIVVDDGSSDKTKEIVESFYGKPIPLRLIHFPNNHGKGWAVKAGIEASTGRYILFTDADLSTPIVEVRKLLNFLEKGYDIAIGSRALQQSILLVRQSWWRQGMGKIFNRLIRLFVLKGIKDTQCGFKCFKNDVAKRLFSLSLLSGFAFDVEILFLASRMKYKIADVPVTWKNNPESKVNPLFDSCRMIMDVVKLKWRFYRNKPDFVKERLTHEKYRNTHARLL